MQMADTFFGTSISVKLQNLIYETNLIITSHVWIQNYRTAKIIVVGMPLLIHGELLLLEVLCTILLPSLGLLAGGIIWFT